jgi:hypothetical protein
MGSADWQKVPAGMNNASITITGGNGKSIAVQVKAKKQAVTTAGFMEANGTISIEAQHYQKAVNADGITWNIIPDYGRTLSGVTTFPVTAKGQNPGGNTPHLEYKLNISDTGAVKVTAYVGPTLDFTGTTGLQYAVSIDDDKPRVININLANINSKSFDSNAKDVSDNVKILTSIHHISRKGQHTLKFWRVDPGVVLEKLVLDFGGVKPSYLGPPESFLVK